MKNLDELTEQEILALTNEEILTLVKLKKAEEGIAFIQEPKKPELFKADLPNVTVYTCTLFGNNLAFTDFDELKSVIDLLENCKSKVSIDSNYDLPDGNRNYITKKLKTQSYSNDPWDKTMSEKVYSNEYYLEIRDQLKENKKLSDQYQKQLEEYESAISESRWIEDEIYNKVNDIKDKYSKLNLYCYKFKFDYLPLADGDTKIAMKFMDKAYSLNDEHKEYILNNYSDLKL